MTTAINEPQEGTHFDMQSELKNIVQSFCTKKLALEKDLTLQHAELAAGMKSQELAFESFSEKMKQAEKEMQVFQNSAQMLNCGGSIADVAEL